MHARLALPHREAYKAATAPATMLAMRCLPCHRSASPLASSCMLPHAATADRRRIVVAAGDGSPAGGGDHSEGGGPSSSIEAGGGIPGGSKTADNLSHATPHGRESGKKNGNGNGSVSAWATQFWAVIVIIITLSRMLWVQVVSRLHGALAFPLIFQTKSDDHLCACPLRSHRTGTNLLETKR